ncbi:hypothetical protein WMY93_030662 [Mugilogobius chulae]|uniref:Smoothelin domain-containing protein n=1 Tax=Mugilogobius chulae TaxID=88201 RepID=A0AAW0MN71_9GOBI
MTALWTEGESMCFLCLYDAVVRKHPPVKRPMPAFGSLKCQRLNSHVGHCFHIRGKKSDFYCFSTLKPLSNTGLTLHPVCSPVRYLTRDSGPASCADVGRNSSALSVHRWSSRVSGSSVHRWSSCVGSSVTDGVLVCVWFFSAQMEFSCVSGSSSDGVLVCVWFFSAQMEFLCVWFFSAQMEFRVCLVLQCTDGVPCVWFFSAQMEFSCVWFFSAQMSFCVSGSSVHDEFSVCLVLQCTDGVLVCVWFFSAQMEFSLCLVFQCTDGVLCVSGSSVHRWSSRVCLVLQCTDDLFSFSDVVCLVLQCTDGVLVCVWFFSAQMEFRCTDGVLVCVWFFSAQMEFLRLSGSSVQDEVLVWFFSDRWSSVCLVLQCTDGFCVCLVLQCTDGVLASVWFFSAQMEFSCVCLVLQCTDGVLTSVWFFSAQMEFSCVLVLSAQMEFSCVSGSSVHRWSSCCLVLSAQMDSRLAQMEFLRLSGSSVTDEFSVCLVLQCTDGVPVCLVLQCTMESCTDGFCVSGSSVQMSFTCWFSSSSVAAVAAAGVIIPMRPDSRSSSSDSLDLLSQKLQASGTSRSSQRCLRSAGEYEERKIYPSGHPTDQREQHQQGSVEMSRAPGRVDSPSAFRTQETESSRAQSTASTQRQDTDTAGSDMVLVFDSVLQDEGPQPLLIQAPRETLNPGPDLLLSQRQRSDSASSDHSSASSASVHSCSKPDSAYRTRLGSGASDKNQGPFQRDRLDSGASDKNQGLFQRDRLDSGASDKNQGSFQRDRLDSGASDKNQRLFQRDRLDSGASDKNQRLFQRDRLDSGASDKNEGPFAQNRLNSGASDKNLGPFQRDRLDSGASECSTSSLSCAKNGVDCDSSETRPGPEAIDKGPVHVTNGSANCTDSEEDSRGLSSSRTRQTGQGSPNRGQNTAITINNSLSNGKPKDAVLEHFSRTNSVRDRLRKYTESTQQQSAPRRTHTEEPVSSCGQSQSSTDAAEAVRGPPEATWGPVQLRSSVGPRVSSSSSSSMGQRTELTLGLRATPFKISSSSFSSAPNIKMETEPVLASEPVFSDPPSAQVTHPAADLPNGAPPKPEERSGKLSPETLAAIEDEELLDRMLDETKDFEERRLIRAAMRDLRKRKREAVLGCTQEQMDQREKERESRLQELRQQRDQKRAGAGPGAGAGTGEVVIRKLEKSADGNTLSQVTKTDRFAQSDDGSRSSRSTVVETSFVQKTDRGMVQSKSYSYSSSSSSSSSTSLSSSTKKVGSVFDREDHSLSGPEVYLRWRKTS